MTTTAPLNVASHLGRLAHDDPDRPALHHPHRGVRPGRPTPYTTTSFKQLHADTDAVAHGLVAAGVSRGVRAALMVPPTPDFFALTFALLKVGAVPVLIDPGMGVRRVGRCLAEADPGAFIGVPKAHVARRALRWLKGKKLVTVNAGGWRFSCDTSLARLRDAGARRGPFRIPDVTADEPAAVLFTSGSTGPAKGAVYTHGVFAAQVELLKATYGIEPGEVDLCTFPLFALFGPALGMTCVLPDMDATRPARLDPYKAGQQIAEMKVTNLFGSPAVVRRLGELARPEETPPPNPLPYEGRGDQTEDPSPRSAPLPFAPPPRNGEGEQAPSRVFSSSSPSLRRGGGRGEGLSFTTLKRVISAGAPARAADIERFVSLLPDGVEVFTPYGATEALPVANIGSRDILAETRHLTDQGRGVCVGRPVAGVDVFVMPISDHAVHDWDPAGSLPPGEVGEVVVRGPVVTKKYFNRPEATKLAKVRDPHGEVMHRMGDVGYLDEQGRLWFCGRKSQRVVTPWGTLFTDMVEPVFNAALPELRTALVGVTRDGATYPVLCFEPGTGRNPEVIVERLLRAAGGAVEHTRRIGTFLPYRRPGGFPVDVRHNAKIDREKLARWADRKLGKTWRPGDNTRMASSAAGAGAPP